ncbi:DNA translocase [Bacillus phage vB_BpsS-36]|uniref:DNA translocase n=1 Tax=Bacillus phage vB_BpsS-36 TaxID=2419622 RepID=A0A3G3BWU4_9CAUD|nr:DNA translocase [Bacillus phage vB_BpsS-36]
MIFEIVTTTLMGGVTLYATLKKSGATNDSDKIQKIFTLSGLNVKDGKETLTAQLVKKNNHDWGMEYKYRIPLGRSFSDYEARKQALEDGLNNRKVKVQLKDLKDVKLDKNIIKSLMELNKKKLSGKKEVELSYDGLLTVRVYDEPLTKELPFELLSSGWSVPVGQGRELNKMVYHDFEKIPHMALGGATRYGKSNFINSMIVSLLHSQPDNVRFHLIDLKGGVELCDYEDIKQTVRIAYEPEEALEVLKGAYEEMRAIQQKLRKMGKKNVQEAGLKERHFIIIDEVGELNPEEAVDKKDIKEDGVIIKKSEKTIKEECQKYMSQIARLGAGLGMRQILATQYGTGDVIPRQCKQNSDAKLCFRVQSGVASRVVLDSEGAEKLPEIKGRAIYQTADKRRILQTPLIKSEVIRQATTPYINIRARKEEVRHETTKRETRKHTVKLEETGLS